MWQSWFDNHVFQRGNNLWERRSPAWVVMPTLTDEVFQCRGSSFSYNWSHALDHCFFDLSVEFVLFTIERNLSWQNLPQNNSKTRPKHRDISNTNTEILTKQKIAGQASSISAEHACDITQTISLHARKKLMIRIIILAATTANGDISFSMEVSSC